MEILAYEMQYNGDKVKSDLQLTLFEDNYYEIYKTAYNDCFYEIRKALDIKPYNVYDRPEQLQVKKANIYLMIQDNELVGSVACCGNEIDDLIVNKKYQGRGYGEKLLQFAVNHIQDKNDDPIKLYVAKWNERAVKLYEKNGFECVNIIKVR